MSQLCPQAEPQSSIFSPLYHLGCVCVFVLLLLSLLLLLAFQDRVSLCIPVCLGTCPIDQDSLKLKRSVCLWFLSAGIKGVHHHNCPGSFKRSGLGVSKICWWFKVLAIKPDHLSLIPGTYVAEENGV